ncbi:glycoside hydrolase family 3 protein [Paenibacillus aquistagni]|uniref:glycoside hydrolase family 3 protein n=1 Tax=Paenibacillus aquistagni TaxID=1852522 RepID=UPI000B512BCF|nr:glycoside hydrolase family 3 protein [Paenibacillus aquistagni]
MTKKRMILYASILVLAAAVIYVFLPSLTTNPNTESPSSTADKVQADTWNTGTVEEQAKKLTALMTDKEKIGQLVMYTPTERADAFSNTMIAEYQVGSALLNRQMQSAQQMAAFTNQLQQWASETRLGIPLFISGDLEYGAAQRVPTEATILPRQMAIGATGNVDYAKQAAQVTAAEAKAMGFQWSFSPVADVNSNLENPVIGVRSFGQNTKLVSDMAVAQVQGYQEEGVLSSAKHFPGHGDTGFDTHSTLANVTYSEEVLRKVHLPPFQAVIDQGIESIMTSHIIIEAIDPELPATLSKKVLTGLLREQMGFKGIIVTDAMVMEAISANWGAGEAAVMAINAGADIVMANGSVEDQYDTLHTLYKALQKGKIDKGRVDDAVERILYYKLKMNLFEQRSVDVEHAGLVVGSPEHGELSNRIAMDSVTLVKNEKVLPLDPTSKEHTLVVSVAYADWIADSVKKLVSSEVTAYQAAPARGEKLDAAPEAVAEAVALAKKADRILVFTQSDRQLPQGQIDLVNQLLATGKPVVTVSLGNPGDILSYPNAKAHLSTYALDNWYWLTPIPVSWEAAVQVIFGAAPKGKLPVALNGTYQEGYGLRYP